MATVPGIALADDGGTNWSAIAACESGGNPRATDASGQHIGMYQFTRSTWRSNGGRGDPRDASPAEQTRVAENVKHSQGMGAWPVCGRHAYDGGYRSTSVVHRPGPPRHAAPEAPAPAPKPRPKPPAEDPSPVALPVADTTPPAPPAAPVVGLLDAGWADTANITAPTRAYTVRDGDTLWSIARSQHVDDTGTTPGWRTLADTNHLDSPDVIQPGQALTLPG